MELRGGVPLLRDRDRYKFQLHSACIVLNELLMLSFKDCKEHFKITGGYVFTGVCLSTGGYLQVLSLVLSQVLLGGGYP